MARQHPQDTDLSTDQQSQLAGLDLEQGLIGCVIYSPEALDGVSGLEPRHFFEPAHGAIWAEILWMQRLGRNIDSTLIHHRVQHLPAYKELGGSSYIADLIDQAPPPSMAADYAKQITELWVRRELVTMGRRTAQTAQDFAISADDALKGAQDALGDLQAGDGRVTLVTAADAALGALAELDQPPEQQRGVYFGLTALDRSLGPLLPGDLCVLGGRPGMGKSALAAVAAINMCCPDIKALIQNGSSSHPMRGVIEINTEMTTQQMARRHLTDICQRMWGTDAPAYADIRKRRITPAQRKMLEEALVILRQIPLLMITQTAMPVTWVRSTVRRQFALWSQEGIDPGLVVIDHVGHMIGGERSRSRTEDQTQVSNGLKALARDLQVPILALAQLNRGVEERDNKRPTLSDLRDSGSWEQDADVVLGAYRDAYYAEQEPEPTGRGAKADMAFASWSERRRSREIEILMLKVREGSRGAVTVWGDMPTNAIRDAAPEERMF